MTPNPVTPLVVTSIAHLAEMPLEAVVEVICAASAKGMFAGADLMQRKMSLNGKSTCTLISPKIARLVPLDIVCCVAQPGG